MKIDERAKEGDDGNLFATNDTFQAVATFCRLHDFE